MTNRAMNVFEFIFGALLILKITKTGIVSDWNWFFVFLPLIIGIIVKFFSWVVGLLGLRREADIAVQDYYIKRIREKAINKVKNKL